MPGTIKTAHNPTWEDFDVWVQQAHEDLGVETKVELWFPRSGAWVTKPAVVVQFTMFDKQGFSHMKASAWRNFNVGKRGEEISMALQLISSMVLELERQRATEDAQLALFHSRNPK